MAATTVQEIIERDYREQVDAGTATPVLRHNVRGQVFSGLVIPCSILSGDWNHCTFRDQSDLRGVDAIGFHGIVIEKSQAAGAFFEEDTLYRHAATRRLDQHPLSEPDKDDDVRSSTSISRISVAAAILLGVWLGVWILLYVTALAAPIVIAACN